VILVSLLVATVCGKSVPLLKPMSQEMIDYINNEAHTTWKVTLAVTKVNRPVVKFKQTYVVQSFRHIH